ATLGFDPKPGAHAKEPAEKQALRQTLVPIVALEARDPDTRKKLETAAVAYLNGDTKAIDPAFRMIGLAVAVQNLGAPFMTKLRDALVKSEDPLFRSHASQALSFAETPELARHAVTLARSPGVQPIETMQIVIALAEHPASRDTVVQLVDQNFK